MKTRKRLSKEGFKAKYGLKEDLCCICGEEFHLFDAKIPALTPETIQTGYTHRECLSNTSENLLPENEIIPLMLDIKGRVKEIKEEMREIQTKMRDTEYEIEDEVKRKRMDFKNKEHDEREAFEEEEYQRNCAFEDTTGNLDRREQEKKRDRLELDQGRNRDRLERKIDRESDAFEEEIDRFEEREKRSKLEPLEDTLQELHEMLYKLEGKY